VLALLPLHLQYLDPIAIEVVDGLQLRAERMLLKHRKDASGADACRVWPGDVLAAKLASPKLTPDLLRARLFRLDADALEELVSLGQELLSSFAWS
jgi:hypothetical protein